VFVQCFSLILITSSSQSTFPQSAVSGTVPEEPVVSKKSGLLFERRLIEKVVQETGRCPITDEPLEKDDLVVVSTGTTIKPRPTPATSIPGLLSLLQNEWDATVLEAHQLRQALHAARQELSHALYQHDAATRVIGKYYYFRCQGDIKSKKKKMCFPEVFKNKYFRLLNFSFLLYFAARLMRERDSYRARMENSQLTAPPPSTAAAADANGKRSAPDATMEDAEAAGEPSKKARPALGSDVIDALTACSTQLSSTRKKRVISPTVATPEEIKNFSLTGSTALHGTRKGGILSLSVSPESDSIIASGGADTNINVFDRAAGQTVATLKGHSKKVNEVVFVGSRSIIASASSDKTVRVWKAENGGEDSEYSCAAIFDDAGGEVVSVSVHPTNNYLISAATDGVWSFYDLTRSECLSRVSQENQAGGGDTEGYTSASLHPDGLILCTGGEKSTVRIWETRTSKCVGKFDGHSGAINSMSFSENGYYMASAAADGVKLWDLRKLKNFKSLTPYGEGAKAPVATAVKFDHSGLFLAVGGADARIYGVKQEWEVVKEFTEVPKKGVCSLAWGTDAKSLFVGAADHNLRVFS
jgi:pre-mRNA-processing factor 19